MSLRSLQAVLYSLTDTGSVVPDAELLQRFLRDDERAFTELVRRHGRLVWSVCRHLSGSDADADDAFQATFLVLLKNAKKVRAVGTLSSWLYGVAHKVCANARRGAQRRTARERLRSAPERNGAAVPESAWDRALKAVHEEVAQLPETLRVPFVLCCLEGKGVTDAAEQLGWKLGTLSSRLTRAKDMIWARLDARGLALGVAVVGLTGPPAVAVAKATALARSGFVVPDSVLQLSQGVIGMSMKSVKMLAVAAVLTCGLGLGLGASWLANVNAQPFPSGPAPIKDPEAEVKRLRAELDRAELAAQRAREARLEERIKEQERTKERSTFKTTKWEYDLVAVRDVGQKQFAELLQDRENRGWEYNGTTVLKDGDRQTVWVFRKPAKGATSGNTNSPFSSTIPVEDSNRNGSLNPIRP